MPNHEVEVTKERASELESLGYVIAIWKFLKNVVLCR
jgi:hypothetical protein